MVNIIIYDDKVAPLYQLLNNNCMLDLLKTIQSYRNTSIIKLSYIEELKTILSSMVDALLDIRRY